MKVHVILYMPDGAPMHDMEVIGVASTQEIMEQKVKTYIKDAWSDEPETLKWPHIGNVYGIWVEEKGMD